MKGFSCISLLCAVAVNGIILLAICSTTHLLIKNRLKVDTALRASREELQLREIMLRLSNDLDTHQLSCGLKVHKNGKILFADGSTNPVMHSSNRPTPESDAVSVLSLESSTALKVLDAESNNAYFDYYACEGMEKLKLDDELTRSFIGLSLDSVVYMKGPVSKSGRKGCYRLHLSTPRNMFVDSSETGSSILVRVLVPVKDEYSWYLSEKGELRYLGHEGSLNVENQPTDLTFQSINFSLRADTSSGVLSLKGDFRVSEKHELTLAASPVLARKSHVNFLLGY